MATDTAPSLSAAAAPPVRQTAHLRRRWAERFPGAGEVTHALARAVPALPIADHFVAAYLFDPPTGAVFALRRPDRDAPWRAVAVLPAAAGLGAVGQMMSAEVDRARRVAAAGLWAARRRAEAFRRACLRAVDQREDLRRHLYDLLRWADDGGSLPRGPLAADAAVAAEA